MTTLVAIIATVSTLGALSLILNTILNEGEYSGGLRSAEGTEHIRSRKSKEPKKELSKGTDARRGQRRLEDVKNQIVEYLHERQTKPVLNAHMKHKIREAIAEGRGIDAMVICDLTPANAMSGVEGVLANNDLDLSGFSPEDTSELVRTYIGVHLDAVRDFVATEHQVRRVFSAESAKSEAALRYASPETTNSAHQSAWDREFNNAGAALESLDEQRAADAQKTSRQVSRAVRAKKMENSITAATRGVQPVRKIAGSSHSHYIKNPRQRAKDAAGGTADSVF